ncbi:MAG: endonuclease III domain-containing protein [Gemmatimonadota bacterium]
MRPATAETPPTNSRRTRALLRIARHLESVYGTRRKPRREPLDELIHTILSQSTADANRDRAWKALRERYPDWEAVRGASVEEIEETIRIAGLAGQKSRTIRGMLERLHEERGAATLDHLREMHPEKALSYLCGFRGVGVKTAACVLCFSLGQPIMPVDTHVHRLAVRLGWVPAGASAARAHRSLNELVPPRLRYSLHVQLIEHGRRVCTARRPACGGCPLAAACPRIGVEDPR